MLKYSTNQLTLTLDIFNLRVNDTKTFFYGTNNGLIIIIQYGLYGIDHMTPLSMCSFYDEAKCNIYIKMYIEQF